MRSAQADSPSGDVKKAFSSHFNTVLVVEVAQALQLAHDGGREAAAAAAAVDQQILQHRSRQFTVAPTPGNAVGNARVAFAQVQRTAAWWQLAQPAARGAGQGAVAFTLRAAHAHPSLSVCVGCNARHEAVKKFEHDQMSASAGSTEGRIWSCCSQQVARLRCTLGGRDSRCSCLRLLATACNSALRDLAPEASSFRGRTPTSTGQVVSAPASAAAAAWCGAIDALPSMPRE